VASARDTTRTNGVRSSSTALANGKHRDTDWALIRKKLSDGRDYIQYCHDRGRWIRRERWHLTRQRGKIVQHKSATPSIRNLVNRCKLSLLISFLSVRCEGQWGSGRGRIAVGREFTFGKVTSHWRVDSTERKKDALKMG